MEASVSQGKKSRTGFVNSLSGLYYRENTRTHKENRKSANEYLTQTKNDLQLKVAFAFDILKMSGTNGSCETKMSFISFNENYYRRRLEALENRPLSRNDIYEAQQLLKVLDDLTDEGYTRLNSCMENDFSCLTRLRALLKKAGASPIPVGHNGLFKTSYCAQESELNEILDRLITQARRTGYTSDNLFLKDIYEYSRWIGYEEDTAYVFLLRDMLLPCLYFKSRYDKSVYPWLISRMFLKDISGIENVDDEIRLPIYEALESGCTAFEDFSAFCKGRMLAVLDKHSELKRILLDLLGTVKEKKIIIAESGYAGTIPMMLKALDERVSFRLYTTAPFLYDTYRDILFCHRYEDMRKFETVYSHNLLLRYSSYRDGRFYVNLSEEDEILNSSLGEVKRFIG